jgi:hypothetical protein
MKLFVMLVLSIILSSCATAYQPKGATGGFSETQLDTNVFKVSFRGNAYTDSERATDLTLLRSAELTLKNDFKYFVIVDDKYLEKNGSYTLPTQSYTTANVTAYGNSAYGTSNTTTTGGQTIRQTRPRVHNIIMCFKEKPDFQGLIYNAEFICKSLGEKYKVICGAQ